MKHKFILGLFFLSILLASCRSISRGGAGPEMPPRQIILSFDDGPNGDTTAQLLDVLQKHGVHAVFSLLGENAEYFPELVRRMYDEGHCIVNHGYADKWARRMGADEFRENLLKGDAAISAALGHDFFPRLYRPHGGFYSSAQEQICREEGYTIVPGNIRIYDAVKNKSKHDKAVRKLIKKIENQNGGIVLLHDGRGSHTSMEAELVKNPDGAFNRSWIPAVVEEIIPVLPKKGFTYGDPGIIFSAPKR